MFRLFLLCCCDREWYVIWLYGLFICRIHILSFLRIYMFVVLFLVVYLLRLFWTDKNSVSTGAESIILWCLEWVKYLLRVQRVGWGTWSGSDHWSTKGKDVFSSSVQLVVHGSRWLIMQSVKLTKEQSFQHKRRSSWKCTSGIKQAWAVKGAALLCKQSAGQQKQVLFQTALLWLSAGLTEQEIVLALRLSA